MEIYLIRKDLTMKENKKNLKKMIYKQNHNIRKRIGKAIKLFGEKITPDLDFKELEKTLNPNNEYKMESLYDFYDFNDDIDGYLIFNELEQNKFIELYDSSERSCLLLAKTIHANLCNHNLITLLYQLFLNQFVYLNSYLF